jgi:hypothetical protein
MSAGFLTNVSVKIDVMPYIAGFETAAITESAVSSRDWGHRTSTMTLKKVVYAWAEWEGSDAFARLVIQAITAVIRKKITMPATMTATKALSKAAFA